MEAKDMVNATQEMMKSGTFYTDTDSLALGLTGQLRNNDRRIEFIDREGSVTEVTMFEQNTNVIVVGTSGAGQSFFIDDLIRQAQEENPSFTKEDAMIFIREKYSIQTIKDEQ